MKCAYMWTKPQGDSGQPKVFPIPTAVEWGAGSPVGMALQDETCTKLYAEFRRRDGQVTCVQMEEDTK